MSLALALLLASGVSGATPRFVEVTDATGIANTHGPLVVSGVAWLDINADGHPDLFVPGGGNPDKLFVNDGPPDYGFTDASADVGLSAQATQTAAVLAADFTSDGQTDLLLIPTGIQNSRPRLLVAADGQLKDESVYRLRIPAMSFSGAAAGDLDGDGDLDVALPRWCTPVPDEAEADHGLVLLQNRDGVLTMTTTPVPGLDGCSLVPAFLDLDGDGDTDLLQISDFGPQIRPNRAFRTGTPTADGFGLTEVGAELGLDAAVYGMGVAVGDIDNNGHSDLLVTSVGEDALLLGQPDGTWVDGTAQWWAGSKLGRDGTRFKWGAAFLDANNNGHQDLLVLAGAQNFHFPWTETPQRSVFLSNSGSPPLQEASEASGLDLETNDHGLALADYNADGLLDVAIGTQRGARLFLNQSEAPGHWVAFALKGTVSNRDAYGARLTVTCNNAKTMRELTGGGTPASTHHRVIHVGLGDCAGPVQALVQWPSGVRETHEALAAGQTHVVSEPQWLTLSAARHRVDDGPVQVTIELDAQKLELKLTGPASADAPQKGVDGRWQTVIQGNAPGVVILELVADGKTLPARPRITFLDQGDTRWGLSPSDPEVGRLFQAGVTVPETVTGALDVVATGASVTVTLDGRRAQVAVLPEPDASQITLQATVDGAAFGAPLVIPLRSAFDPARSGVRVAPAWLLPKEDEVSISVTLRTQTGAHAVSPGLRDKLRVQVDGESIPTVFTDGDDGFSASVPADSVRGRTVTVFVDDIPLEQTVSLGDAGAIVGSDISATHSFFSFFHRHVYADGQDIVPVWWALRDSNGQDLVVDPLRLALEVTGGAQVIAPSTQWTFGRHEYFAWVQVGDQTGTLKAVLLLDGKPTGLDSEIPAKTPAAVPWSPARSEIVTGEIVTGDSVTLGSFATVSIFARDASGNRVGSGVDYALSAGDLPASAAIYAGLGEYRVAFGSPAEACTAQLVLTRPGSEEVATAELHFVAPGGAVSSAPCRTADSGDEDCSASPLPGSSRSLWLVLSVLAVLGVRRRLGLRRRPGVRQALLALVLATALGCSSDPEPEPVIPAPDINIPSSDVWHIVDPGFDAMSVVCPDRDARVVAQDHGLTLGVFSGPDATFRPVEDGEPITIIRGPQGGIHLEIGFSLDAGPEYDETNVVHTRLAGQTVQPSCGGDVVGAMTEHRTLLYRYAPGGPFLAPSDNVIFFNNGEGHFEDQGCCIALRVGIAPPGEQDPTEWHVISHCFQCVSTP
ncbi:MAG: hypothetical protein ACI9WU_000107 [Myxococcota bacterium]|jgi:hypothetical protein